MATRTIECSCGGLTASVSGDPARVSVCSCLNCKRRSGSAFSWNATFAEAQVTVAGEHAHHSRTSEDGFWVRHHFCPTCGTRVFYMIEQRPGMVSIPAGLFGEADFAPPTVEVFGERRCPWLPELAPIQE
jgi:hypothetical protein